MDKKDNEIVATIKPWLGGFNQYSLYITIPSKIVKKLGITQDSILYVSTVDDDSIIIKKTINETTKNKIKNYNNSKSESNINDESMIQKEDFKNPLDRLDNI